MRARSSKLRRRRAGSTVVHEELGDFAAAVRDVPQLRGVLRSPQLDPAAKAGILEDMLGGADELVRNFLLLAAEKGRIGEIEEIARELDRLVAAEERRVEARPDDRLRALRRRRARDRRADRGLDRPLGRGDAPRRSQPDRRSRAPGRFPACRRVRARPARTTTTRTSHKELGVPPSNTRRLLARDHAAPDPTLVLIKA